MGENKMLSKNTRWLLAASLLVSSTAALADKVPYSVQSVRAAAGAGFVELVGPGKVEVEGRAEEYSETVYLNAAHIANAQSVFGNQNACVLRYAAPGYTESISILRQGCAGVMAEIAKARAN
jgi:hypothetical protein